MSNKQTPTVKKSNLLARARWATGSIWEPRLVALLASKIKWEDEDLQVYQIHVSELFGKNYGGKDFDELEAAIDKAMSRVLTIQDDKGWSKYNLFSKCRFIRQEGILELGFHPDLKIHYLQLKRYVKYNLTDFLKLPSVYSQRLFEIVKSWSDKPEITLPISELHEMLNTPPSMRRDFRQFRLRVLEKAKNDIWECASFQFGWEAIKKGRSVVSIRFVFTRKEIIMIQEEKTDIEKEKLRQKHNRQFQQFISCYNARGSSCQGGFQPKDICDLCRQLR